MLVYLVSSLLLIINLTQCAFSIALSPVNFTLTVAHEIKKCLDCNHYAKPSGPGGTRHFQLSQFLPEYGWKPFILAASTEHHTGYQRLDSNQTFRLDTVERVPFFDCLHPLIKEMVLVAF